jgi:hypothetical protein
MDQWANVQAIQTGNGWQNVAHIKRHVQVIPLLCAN